MKNHLILFSQSVFSAYWRRFALISLLIGFIGTVAINVWMFQYTQVERYQQLARIPKADTALILGAMVHTNGSPSDMLRARLREGLALYQQGKVKKLLLSGDHGQIEYDEVNVMRRYLLDRGVNAKDIFLDHAGFSTYDSLYRAKAIFQLSHLIVVTQKFHLPRAIYTAKVLGLEALGLEAEKYDHSPRVLIRLQIREFLARLKAFIELHVLHAQPKYLGEHITMDGDGRVTWDSF